MILARTGSSFANKSSLSRKIFGGEVRTRRTNARGLVGVGRTRYALVVPSMLGPRRRASTRLSHGGTADPMSVPEIRRRNSRCTRRGGHHDRYRKRRQRVNGATRSRKSQWCGGKESPTASSAAVTSRRKPRSCGRVVAALIADHNLHLFARRVGEFPLTSSPH